ncbi:uncharacterized protein [Rutidosis leptorrhynchoides]|uniref:uncharacterized protein n=1 Tax=Rutidosis leptorrhynchoides TaxID=125765 RepID=UPI003A9A5ECA
MQLPRSKKKDVQSLNGKLAALTRSADRSLPFFNTLKGCLNKKDFVWTEDAEKAFHDMKAFLKELPTLTAPIQGETLTVYLYASSEVISSVLIVDRGKVQIPVYFVSKVLQNGEGKAITAILPSSPDTGPHGSTNQTCLDKAGDIREDGQVDEASSEEGAVIGLLLVSPNGEEITYVIRLKFAASNNEAEYEALLAGLRLAKSIDVQRMTAYVSSQLVESQLNGSFEARDISMQKCLKLAKALVIKFAAFEIKQIPRNRNKKADALSKLVSLLYDHFTKKVTVEVIERKSTDEDILMATITEKEDCWMTPFIQYLNEGILPDDKLEAQRIRMRALMYHFQDGILYMKSFTESYLRCVGPTQAKEIIQEMHEGACSTHSGY